MLIYDEDKVLHYEGRAGQGRTGQGRAGHDRTVQGSAGQGRAGFILTIFNGRVHTVSFMPSTFSAVSSHASVITMVR